MSIDFSRLQRQPSRKEAEAYRKWIKYLKDSRLSDQEVYRRAAWNVENRKLSVPND